VINGLLSETEKVISGRMVRFLALQVEEAVIMISFDNERQKKKKGRNLS
jgi:hypothetical protein